MNFGKNIKERDYDFGKTIDNYDFHNQKKRDKRKEDFGLIGDKPKSKGGRKKKRGL